MPQEGLPAVFVVRKFKDIVSGFMPPGMAPESADTFKTQATISVSLLVGSSGFPFMVLFFFMGHFPEAAVVLWSWLFFMYIPFLARRKVRPSLLAHLLAANYFQCHLFLCLIWGGVDAPNSMWFAAMPIVSMLVGGISHGLIWGGITAVSVLVIYGVEVAGWVHLTSSLESEATLFVFGTGTVALLGAILGSTAAFEMFRVAAMERRLEAERELIAANEELKIHEAELQGSTDRAERLLVQVEAANEAKSRFLAQISHELRTPLNGILGSSEAIREGVYGPLTDGQMKALKTLDRAANHQLSLVNDLLDLTKIEKGSFEPHLEAVSLSKIVEEVFQFLGDRAHQGGIRLQVGPEPEVVVIETDARRVRQMLLNLVGNAIKFTPEGSVTVTCESQGEMVAIHVRDTGIGIAPEELPRMFEAFTQVDSVLQRQHAGSGLGLSLTAKFAELLGGEIQATSTPNKGSTFTILLPNTPPKDEAAAALLRGGPPTNQPPQEEESAEQENAPDGGLHVLLVDDTEANILHIRDFLRMKGHRVSTASNGLDAIERAQERPDIIFMDIQMPEMDGFEAIGRLRADPHTKNLHIVSLTSFARGEDREQCLQAGADDYESKPVSIKRVLELVEARRDR